MSPEEEKEAAETKWVAVYPCLCGVVFKFPQEGPHCLRCGGQRDAKERHDSA